MKFLLLFTTVMGGLDLDAIRICYHLTEGNFSEESCLMGFETLNIFRRLRTFQLNRISETLEPYGLQRLAESVCEHSNWSRVLTTLIRDLNVLRRSTRRVKSPYSRDVCKRPCQHMSRHVNKKTLLNQLGFNGDVPFFQLFPSKKRHLGNFSVHYNENPNKCFRPKE